MKQVCSEDLLIVWKSHTRLKTPLFHATYISSHLNSSKIGRKSHFFNPKYYGVNIQTNETSLFRRFNNSLERSHKAKNASVSRYLRFRSFKFVKNWKKKLFFVDLKNDYYVVNIQVNETSLLQLRSKDSLQFRKVIQSFLWMTQIKEYD